MTKSFFSDQIIESVESRIRDRVVSVQDYINRKHPIPEHYKLSDSRDLTRMLMHCLLTLSDTEKDQIIKVLESLKSKP